MLTYLIQFVNLCSMYIYFLFGTCICLFHGMFLKDIYGCLSLFIAFNLKSVLFSKDFKVATLKHILKSEEK